MQKKYQITEEEFCAIKDAITSVLNLWQYEFIEANDGYNSAMAMSKEAFFERLRSEFIVK